MRANCHNSGSRIDRRFNIRAVATSGKGKSKRAQILPFNKWYSLGSVRVGRFPRRTKQAAKFLTLFPPQEGDEFLRNRSPFEGCGRPKKSCRPRDAPKDQRRFRRTFEAFQHLKHWVAAEGVVHPSLPKLVPQQIVPFSGTTMMEYLQIRECLCLPPVHSRGDLRVPVFSA